MNFLKQNLFLVGTAVVLVVVSAALVMFARSATDRVDKYVADRTGVNSSMVTLMSGQPVNRDVVEAAEGRVDEMRLSHQRVAMTVLTTNTRHYRVLDFPDPDSPDKKRIPAFPIDQAVYDAKALRLQFPERCRQELAKLVASMRPTAPPTTEEIADEVERTTGQEGRTGVPGSGSRPPVMMPSRLRESTMYRPLDYARPRYTTGTGEAEGERELTADEKARRNLTYDKARAGWIYADENSLYTGLLATSTHYTDDVLFAEQVALWAQRDIVAVINKTNAEAQRASKQEKGVPSSAVKRLVGVMVLGYVVKPAAVPSSASGAGGARREATLAGPADRLTYLGTAGPGSANPPQLTRRACDKIRDVVHYTFTVVMSSDEVLRLQRNLMLESYHTILNVSLTQPGQTQAGRGPADYRRTAAADLYYYGRQHVVEATITGELQLLTNWTRGRWDAKAKQWDKKYPPLMPAEFLARLAGYDAGALRDEDNARLEAAGATGSPATDRPAVIGAPSYMRPEPGGGSPYSSAPPPRPTQ